LEIEKMILEKIESNNGYITTKEINELGINRFYLSKLEKIGKIERIKRGVYRIKEKIVENEIFEINRLVPKGVLCLESAAEYYGLTTVIPNEYQVAIEREIKVVLPEYPPIKLYYYNKKSYELGVEEIEKNGEKLKIYDIEKTICDITKYRNKIGKNVYKEILKNYKIM